jgi:rhodanese-related sulfurtransferase
VTTSTTKATPPTSTAVASPFSAGVACPGGYRDITPAQAAAARGLVRMIDVRETDELTGELGHIDGIEHVPLATVPTAAASWPRDADLILVCRSGGRSGRAAEALAKMGFTRLMNMAGGMIAYNAATLPGIRR